MPIDDWQFWIVTILALTAVVLVIRPLIPYKSAAPRCGSCPSADPDGSHSRTRATLTVEGRRPD
jgi:NhaP-type Na+/H+ or K+/H+ antiporter